MKWRIVAKKDLSEEIAGKERQIGGPFSQTAHEIRKPVLPVRNIDSHAKAVAHQLLLQIGAHAVEHLKLEVLFGNFLFGRTTDGGRNHSWVMGGNPVIEAARQKHAHQL